MAAAGAFFRWLAGPAAGKESRVAGTGTRTGGNWGEKFVLVATFVLLGAAAAPPPPPRQPYLPRAALVEAANELAPPPAPGSAAELADKRFYREVTLNASDRQVQRARKLINMIRPAYRQALSCAFGSQIDPQTTPELWALLLRADLDASQASAVHKARSEGRPRPNAADGSLACDGRTAESRPGFSYPSRHAASGYLWGLVLAELHPARRNDLLEFGTETGDLWVACRINWRSDAEQGRRLAQALFPRLMKQPAFKADLAKARAALSAASPPFSC